MTSRARKRRPLALAIAATIATLALAGCEPPAATRPSADTGPVSQPTPLVSAPPVEVSNLPPEISSPIKAPSNAPLPTERDVMTAGEVLNRLRARLSTPTCIVGPNNTRWRHKYAGYPQHFAQEVQDTLPMMLVVLDQLEQNKLPGEFALIPIVESWYRTDVHSFGGAAGMWQMLSETSRNNGATVVGGYDGRLSALDSTEAALNYLGKLHAMFNDWRLTAMAYNSGEYRLMRTMPADELAAREAGGGVHYRRPNGLSMTTYEYVSKMRALTCLLAQPERQGIPFDNSAPVQHWVPYTMPADIDSLDELAQRLGTDADALRNFNRGFHNGRIVADAPRMVLVPASTRPRWGSAGGTAVNLPKASGPAGSANVSGPPTPRASVPAFAPPTPAATRTVPAAPGSSPNARVVNIAPLPVSTAPAPSAPAGTATVTTAAPGPRPDVPPAARVATPSPVPPPQPASTAPAPPARPSIPAAASGTTASGTFAPPSVVRPVVTPVPASRPDAGAATPPPAPVDAAPLSAPPGSPSASDAPRPSPVAPAATPSTTGLPVAPRSAPPPSSSIPASKPAAGAASPPQASAQTPASTVGTVARDATATATTGSAPAAGTAGTAGASRPNSAIAPPEPPHPVASAPAQHVPATDPAVVKPAAAAAMPSPTATPAVAHPPDTTAAQAPPSSANAGVSGAPATATPPPSKPVQPPAASASLPPSLPARAAISAPHQPRTHRVRIGDSVETIAQRYGLKVEDLRAWNHLDGDTKLFVDQELKLEP